MDPEFRAFIDSVTEPVTKVKHSGTYAAHKTQPAAESLTEIFALLANAFREIGPYGCQLRTTRRIKSVAKCCARREAIGFHGLV